MRFDFWKLGFIQLKIQRFLVGINKDFWPEYLPLTDLQEKFEVTR